LLSLPSIRLELQDGRRCTWAGTRPVRTTRLRLWAEILNGRFICKRGGVLPWYSGGASGPTATFLITLRLQGLKCSTGAGAFALCRFVYLDSIDTDSQRKGESIGPSEKIQGPNGRERAVRARWAGLSPCFVRLAVAGGTASKDFGPASDMRSPG
jgi:hypothetical protein